MQHEVRAARKPAAGESTNERAHLVAAARWSKEARRELIEPPECPEAFLYLVEWAYRLVGRSGMGLDGPAPLNPMVARSWAEGMGLTLEPEELEALMVLDAAIRRPEPPAEPDDEPEEEQQPVPEAPRPVPQPRPLVGPAWPERKPGVEPKFAPRDPND